MSSNDVDIPEAEPLPALDETEKTSATAVTPAEELTPEQAATLGQAQQDEEEEAGPPPLPPLLELAGSNIATTGGLAYGAAGVAGLLAVGAVATVGTAAYLAKGARERRDRRERAALRGGVEPGRRGFRSLVRGAGPGGRGALGGGPGRGRGLAGGVGGLAGRARSGASGAGGRSGLFGSRSGGGAGRGGALAGGRSGGGAGLLGRSGGSAGGLAGRSGGASGGRWGGAGSASRGGLAGGRSSGGGSLFGPGRSGGAHRAGARGGGRSGARGLFGAARRRPFGRVTAISDPAMPTRASGRRPLRGAFGAVRRGWNHPRTRRGRVRFRRASERTRDYMRKRARRLRTTAFWHSLAGWWGRLWGRIRGDERYGPMSSASAAASALAVAALGPSRRRSAPRRVITGRVIGTSARTPGELSSARRPLAIGAGASGTELEGHPMSKKPGEIIRAETAADEMQAALAAFGGADVHMLTYEQGLIALPQILRRIGHGLGQMSSSAEGEQPLDPAVVEFMHQISAAVHQVADVSDELPGLFRAAHEKELELLEDRRPHAERWDRSRRDS
ncbi:hypothetical protein [Nocardiopsis metallicus]|uniref:Uncharacterized protein n=1 Tax=Nocardiopsis metallicus TaxID=179819 RepID=A0A840WFR4_9ACTN|nr:hypothetical protein [Nocardiopsis metallicus]MBB5495809.1 hypothetical protein [Nocardiopsis metallicus]